MRQTTANNGPIKATIAETHTHLSAKTPDAKTLAEIDASLTAWIENRILAHEQASEGAYLDDAQAHMKFVQNLGVSNIEGLLPETQTAVDTATFWFESLSEELLVENFSEAKSLIETSGTSYQEIDLILETGLVLHDEFLEYGFEAEANDLLELAKLRIEETIENGLDVYKNQILAENMTLERVALYKEEADLFYSLSEDYPRFSEYVQAIEEGVKIGQLQACAVVASDIENRANQRISVLVGNQSLPLKPLACSLYINGHLLTDLSVARDGASGSISLLENNEDEIEFEIAASGEDNMFWGSSDTWDTAGSVASICLILCPTTPPSPRTGTDGSGKASSCGICSRRPSPGALRMVW